MVYISIGVCENLSRRWNEATDEEEKKKLTIKCWFLHFYSVRVFGSQSE